MADWLVPLLTFAFGIIVGLLLLARRYRLRPTEVSFPFMKFEVSQFEALTPVRMFNAVTMLVLPQAAETWSAGGASAPIMIHAGWTMVCDAFVRRFRVYPDDAGVMAQVGAIGGQNAEFVIMFRRIYEASMREADAIDRAFATEYLSRAPAMAQRLSADSRTPREGLAIDLLGM